MMHKALGCRHAANARAASCTSRHITPYTANTRELSLKVDMGHGGISSGCHLGGISAASCDAMHERLKLHNIINMS